MNRTIADYLRYKFSYVLDLLPPLTGIIADVYYWLKGG